MHPTLFEIAHQKFHAYPTMLAAAFLTCTLLATYDLNRQRPPIYATPLGGLWGFLGALFGAKLFWVLQFGGIKYWYYAFFIWEGGLVFYGGLIGGLLGVYAYASFAGLPKLRMADVVAPYLALGEAITRIGCFLNGCCWGGVTAAPWGVQFPRHSIAYSEQLKAGLIPHGATLPLPVHPTQLYMTFGLLAVALMLLQARNRKRFDGSVALGYLFFYGILRFAVEMFRGDSARSVYGMTVSQVISLGLVALAVAVYLVARRMPKRATAQDASETPQPENAKSDEPDTPAS